MEKRERVMSSLERKTRLETLEHMRFYGLRRQQEERGGAYGKALPFALLGALAGSFILGTQRAGASRLTLLLGACATSFALLSIFMNWKQRSATKEVVLSPNEALDELLLRYAPIDTGAYRELQETVRKEKTLTNEALEEFLRKEHRAINEHLSPHTPWAFAQKSLKD